MSIPFYGNAWTLSSNVVTPPALGSGFAQAAGPFIQTAGSLSYREICYYVLDSGWNVVQDSETQMGPYAYSPLSPIKWVGYDDPDFVTMKAKYALAMGRRCMGYQSIDDFLNKCGTGTGFNPLLTIISWVILYNIYN